MGNICGQQEESEYARTIKKHRQENPELNNVLKSSDWAPDAMSGPQREKYQGGSFKYKNDIDEKLKYTDKEFPADISSLLKEENKPYAPEYVDVFSRLKWKRATQINELNDAEGTLQLFADGINPNDIKQQGLGDCYLMCVFSVIAEVPQRIKNIFEQTVLVPEGVYGLNMYKNGKKVHVIIDDYIPVDENGQLYMSKAHGNELWVILIEKAYAKLHGSYERISGGLSHEALRDLTGAPSLFYMDEEVTGNIDQTWEMLNEADHHGYIIAAGIGDKGDQNEYYTNQLGVIPGHAYGVIAVAEVFDKQENLARIVQVRNPWGSFEWKGDWSDHSDKWTPETKKQVGFTDAEDGTFWIQIEDYIKIYDMLCICKINDSYNFSSTSELNFSTSKSYELVKMTINETGKHIIAFSQKDERCYPRECGYQYQPHRIIVAKALNGSNLNGGIEFLKSKKSGARLLQERDNYLEFDNLEKGSYYILLDVDINPETFKEDPPMYLNNYGPGKTTFSIETSSVKIEKFIQLAFASKIQKNPSCATRTPYEKQGAPGLTKYADQKSDWGYIIFYYEHKGSSKTLCEDMQIRGQGLKMVSGSSNTIQIDGLAYKTTIGPNSTGIVIIKNDLFGYSFGMGGRASIKS